MIVKIKCNDCQTVLIINVTAETPKKNGLIVWPHSTKNGKKRCKSDSNFTTVDNDV